MERKRKERELKRKYGEIKEIEEVRKEKIQKIKE